MANRIKTTKRGKAAIRKANRMDEASYLKGRKNKKNKMRGCR